MGCRSGNQDGKTGAGVFAQGRDGRRVPDSDRDDGFLEADTHTGGAGIFHRSSGTFAANRAELDEPQSTISRATRARHTHFKKMTPTNRSMKSLPLILLLTLSLTPVCQSAPTNSFGIYLTAEPVDRRILAYGTGDWSHLKLESTPAISD